MLNGRTSDQIILPSLFYRFFSLIAVSFSRITHAVLPQAINMTEAAMPNLEFLGMNFCDLT